MKLTIKHPDSCPVGARPSRRFIGDIHFIRQEIDGISGYRIRREAITFDTQTRLYVDASYNLSNRILSLIAWGEHGESDECFFAVTTEFDTAPAYFCACLPTGQYVEFTIEVEAT